MCKISTNFVTNRSKCSATEEWATSWPWYICWDDQLIMLLCIRYWTVSILMSLSADTPLKRRSISVRPSPSLLALFHTHTDIPPTSCQSSSSIMFSLTVGINFIATVWEILINLLKSADYFCSNPAQRQNKWQTNCTHRIIIINTALQVVVAVV